MLSMIVAMAKNYVIGKDNQLIWHLPEDLKRFKKLTTGHTIIMGRKTFESLGRILPNRRHVILCHDMAMKIENENIEILEDISMLEKYIQSEEEHFVIGGATIYRLLMPYANKLYITKIEEEFDQIAEGKEEWKQIIRNFYGPFSKTVEKVEKELEHVKLEYEVSDVPCEKCGRMMVIKYGKYGKFLACPGYPECRNAKPIIETIDVPCPVCGGVVQVRKTKKRRNYYICENNKGENEGCTYISWNKPKPGEKFVPASEDLSEIKKEKKTKKVATKKTTKKKATAKKKAATKKKSKK